MPIELKGLNYYSKVFKRINYRLSNSTFWVVINGCRLVHAKSCVYNDPYGSRYVKYIDLSSKICSPRFFRESLHRIKQAKLSSNDRLRHHRSASPTIPVKIFWYGTLLQMSCIMDYLWWSITDGNWLSFASWWLLGIVWAINKLEIQTSFLAPETVCENLGPGCWFLLWRWWLLCYSYKHFVGIVGAASTAMTALQEIAWFRLTRRMRPSSCLSMGNTDALQS